MCEDSRRVLLVCAPGYILFPFVLSIFLVIYLSVAGSSRDIEDFIHLACDLGVKAEYENKALSISEFKPMADACTQSYMYNVRHEIVWAIVRCGLQVPLSDFVRADLEGSIRSGVDPVHGSTG
jgi:hypothetical protein